MPIDPAKQAQLFPTNLAVVAVELLQYWQASSAQGRCQDAGTEL